MGFLSELCYTQQQLSHSVSPLLILAVFLDNVINFFKPLVIVLVGENFPLIWYWSVANSLNDVQRVAVSI